MNNLNVDKFKKCQCGHSIEHERVKIKDYYSLLGWFWWTMGTTAIPKKIDFTCQDCKQTFDEITEKEEIKHFIFYRKH